MDQSMDDFLSFKDFNNVHGKNTNTSTNAAPAQINVNSPEKSTSSRGRDHLKDFLYDMSNSVQAMEAKIAKSSGAAGAGGGGGAGSSAGVSPMFSESSGSAPPIGENAKTPSVFSIEYYQKFFNVDSYMVLDRIASSMIPQRAPGNYLKMEIGQNPDLYGPFWITITLIFSIAISGNVASYLQHATDNYKWRYNFHLVSIAASSIFFYACLIPVLIWASFKYSIKPVEQGQETENANYTPSLLSLLCVYGYSLAIYIPVSILWVIQISILQWLLVVTAAFLSGIVLITVLTPALRNSKLSVFIILGILAAHFLLAAGFMLKFFHVPSGSNQPDHIVPPHVSPAVIVTTAATVLKHAGIVATSAASAAAAAAAAVATSAAAAAASPVVVGNATNLTG